MHFFHFSGINIAGAFVSFRKYMYFNQHKELCLHTQYLVTVKQKIHPAFRHIFRFTRYTHYTSTQYIASMYNVHISYMYISVLPDMHCACKSTELQTRYNTAAITWPCFQSNKFLIADTPIRHQVLNIFSDFFVVSLSSTTLSRCRCRKTKKNRLPSSLKVPLS